MSGKHPETTRPRVATGIKSRAVRAIRWIANRLDPGGAALVDSGKEQMLYTATGAALDEIATMLGHEPRGWGEPDQAFRERMLT